MSKLTNTIAVATGAEMISPTSLPSPLLTSPRGAVSSHHFLVEPHRNRYTVVLSRNTHMAFHFGQAILAKAKLIDVTMAKLLGRRSRIGVCALNPHAGEEGLFGDEEKRIIAPAVQQAKLAGLTIEGPLPADTLMVRARDGHFDAVVAMYHDQGHIALKLLGMHRAVNITLGLPIVRTSVAHGTAFDLAWRGVAETSSTVEAIRVACQIAARKSGVME